MEHSFYPNAVKLMKGQIFSDNVMDLSMCADPRLPVATPMCCPDTNWETAPNWGSIHCNYHGERTTYAGAQAVCAANGMFACQPGIMKEHLGGDCALGCRHYYFRSWAAVGCELKVKIEVESGNIAIVHNPALDLGGQSIVEPMVDIDTFNYFKGLWGESGHPSTMSECLAIPSCVAHSDGFSCICTVDSPTDVTVFGSSNEIATTEDIMAALLTGAVDPATFDAGTYTSLGDCGITGAMIYSKNGGDCSTFDADTIFSLEKKSKQYFLKNIKSTVSITGSSFSFRNPVQFNSLADPAERDMLHETDAVIDSLFYYPSHAPFLAKLMIQRLGVSNPTPAFVERVVNAYSSGSYNGNFGSGQYGDLGAMTAAILLDSESRSTVLDADQTHGQVREPLVKVLSFFRSMGIAFKSPLRIATLLDLEGDIGQGSFESPSVFSFFLPEFTPSTPAVQSAGLVAPETMVLQGDNILTLLDSMYNTVKFGVTDSGICDDQAPSFEGWRSGVGDFGFKLQPPLGDNCADHEGDTSLTPAAISYQPSSTATVDDVLNELSVLLTAGRLSDNNRNIIRSAMNDYFATDVGKATRIAQQLLLSTPEFHATSMPRKQGQLREIGGYSSTPTEPYKALVVRDSPSVYELCFWFETCYVLIILVLIILDRWS